jgi:hypothetical protein
MNQVAERGRFPRKDIAGAKQTAEKAQFENEMSEKHPSVAEAALIRETLHGS